MYYVSLSHLLLPWEWQASPPALVLHSCPPALSWHCKWNMFKKKKGKKKKIILLSTLTFSPNFCFDSESYLSSYQGIKITTSFGPSSFLWPGSLFCGYVNHCSIFPMVCVCSSYFRALELAFPCAWNALPSLMSLSGQILDNQVSIQRSAFQMSFIALLSQV